MAVDAGGRREHERLRQLQRLRAVAVRRRLHRKQMRLRQRETLHDVDVNGGGNIDAPADRQLRRGGDLSVDAAFSVEDVRLEQRQRLNRVTVSRSADRQ